LFGLLVLIVYILLFILLVDLYLIRVGVGRFSGEYTMGKHPGEMPSRYALLWKEQQKERAMLSDLHRTEVRHWRDHRRTLAAIQKRNQHYYRQHLYENRMKFFDDALWDLMTEEEQALERNTRNMKEAQEGHAELKVAMRRK
jgi:hypothetical protein